MILNLVWIIRTIRSFAFATILLLRVWKTPSTYGKYHTFAPYVRVKSVKKTDNNVLITYAFIFKRINESYGKRTRILCTIQLLGHFNFILLRLLSSSSSSSCDGVYICTQQHIKRHSWRGNRESTDGAGHVFEESSYDLHRRIFIPKNKVRHQKIWFFGSPRQPESQLPNSNKLVARHDTLAIAWLKGKSPTYNCSRLEPYCVSFFSCFWNDRFEVLSMFKTRFWFFSAEIDINCYFGSEKCSDDKACQNQAMGNSHTF